jgi:hypothetical protein
MKIWGSYTGRKMPRCLHHQLGGSSPHMATTPRKRYCKVRCTSTTANAGQNLPRSLDKQNEFGLKWNVGLHSV